MEVFWETSAVYAKALDELGQRIVFARDGVQNQTVNLEASLIGVYTLRFYLAIASSTTKHVYYTCFSPSRFYTLVDGEKVWASEEMELVITRANLATKKIITIMVFVLVGSALCFMGLEIDMGIVWACIKV